MKQAFSFSSKCDLYGTICAFFFAVASVILLTQPLLFAQRFFFSGPDVDLAILQNSAARVIYTLGIIFLLLAAGFAVRSLTNVSDKAIDKLMAAISCVSYVALSLIYLDWHVDDAAITYAYSNNLANGFGLVLHPSLPPQEAYSNTLWMLILAAVSYVGLDIPAVSKFLATAIGITTIIFCYKITANYTLGRMSGVTQLLLTSILLTAPFIIWSVSGLEHSLQALLLIMIVYGIQRSSHDRWISACAASAFILVRPEAPLVLFPLGITFLVYAYLKESGIKSILYLWPVATFPIITFIALLGFRLFYFDDLMPNPFYVKGSGANFLTLLNVFGGGWNYVLSWLQSSAVVTALILWGFLRFRNLPKFILAAFALLAGQISFVIYAGGDWMGHWRFLAATTPLIAIISAFALENIETPNTKSAARIASCIAIVFILQGTIFQLVTFRAAPTTPFSTVASIAKTFADLGSRLNIDEPLLAHHDAGGTSYKSTILLLDLAGIGDKTIAKNMQNPAFLTKYIIEDKQPDFVFGALYFAALYSGFHTTELFNSRYVRLEFNNNSQMTAHLSYIRRDRAIKSPGVNLIYEGGELVKVVVFPGTLSPVIGPSNAAL